MGYSLQVNVKTREGRQHPDRDLQFRRINTIAGQALEEHQPIISIDAKKKELVGDFKNAGREWRPKGEPELVRVHDFKDKQLGKATPYGVYDIAADQGWVNVGIDHDTAQFAVNSAGGSISEAPATPTRGACRSLPTVAAPMETEPGCGRSSFRSSQTRSTSRSTSATYRRAPRSGTGSSIGCFLTSR